MRAKFAIPALAIATALTLSGCVNNEEPTTPDAGTNDGGTVDAALAALLPDDIKESGEIQVGVDATYPPNDFKDADGNAVGWDIELFDAAAAKLGVEVVYNIAGFDTIIPSIVGGKYDAGVSSFTDNVEREEIVDFVNYYSAGISWASASGTTVDPDNACGLKVAAQTGTIEEQEDLPTRSQACTDAGKPAIEILKFDGQDQSTNAVILGQADAMSADSPITAYAIKQSDGKLQAAGASFDVAPYGVVVNKGSKLAQALQAAYQSIVDDGTYAAILNEWGVADGALAEITINAAGNE